MKPFTITVLNSLTLIVMGIWGYISSFNPSATAFIPVIAGIILLGLAWGIKTSSRTIAHLAVILTLLILIALVKPLSGSISREDTAATFRVLIMMATCLIALLFYIKSFIDARRQRG